MYIGCIYLPIQGTYINHVVFFCEELKFATYGLFANFVKICASRNKPAIRYYGMYMDINNQVNQVSDHNNFPPYGRVAVYKRYSSYYSIVMYYILYFMSQSAMPLIS